MTEAPEVVRQLVARFEEHKATYKSSSYNEENLRVDFLNPFFEALGWDVSNELNVDQTYRDVVQEEVIRVGDWPGKLPDYTFRIGKERKFFVEAKKPFENLLLNKNHAYQLRRYGWSSQLNISILTDFEELVVYETTTRPKLSDSAASHRVLYIKFDEYLDRWEEIYELFSRESIINGSLEKFAQAKKLRKGTTTVDTEFLKEIEKWRSLLAEDIAKNNQALSIRELNFAVQKIIDRIIFLRVCEDRGLESYGRLQGLQNGVNVYGRLTDIFYQADEKYNSGLFHFSATGVNDEARDTFTIDLNVGDISLKEIFKNLYYPESPFVFEVLPQEILGQVYEQFLGKVIRLNDKHEAIIEEKPEVRKSGGVYYTPSYIIEYIVSQTVGKLVEGKTPKQVEKLRILDPACGSGSFLLGAYTFLLDWYRDWYVKNNPQQYARGSKPSIYHGGNGDWKLTLSERRKILLNNIYGVDLDYQAVEVSKLTLLMKLLEGERQQHFADIGILPSLGKNIKCGNSLIGTDFYHGQQLDILKEEEKYRINAFDWNIDFKDVMENGKFDAVIGNPPYIRIQTLREWAPIEADFYKDRYKSASSGNYDIYVVFIEKGLSLLNKNGFLGFIVPNKFFNAKYGESLREIISSGKHISQIVNFGDQQVFKNATTYTTMLFLSNLNSRAFEVIKVNDLSKWRNGEDSSTKGIIDAKDISSKEWNFVTGIDAILFKKLDEIPTKLKIIADRIYQGPITSADDVFLFKKYEKIDDKSIKVFSKKLNKIVELESALLKPVIRSGDIGRYWALPKAYVLFPYLVEGNIAKIIDPENISKEYPKTWNYLREFENFLRNRENSSFDDNQWYRFGRTQNLGMWERPKILIPYMVKDLSVYFDMSDNFYFINVTTGGYGITFDNRAESYLYFCGLLNSRLLNFFFKKISTPFNGGYFASNKQFIEKLPIKVIEFHDLQEKNMYDQIVQLVSTMLRLQKTNNNLTVEQERIVLKRQIESVDNQIDKLVYELYGLTEDEIKIVEEK